MEVMGINVVATSCIDISLILFLDKIMEVIPELVNSVILRSMWLTGRICPDSDSSPIIPVECGIAKFFKLDIIAAAMAKSHEVSSTAKPPATLINISNELSDSLTCFSITATNRLSLFTSNPSAILRGLVKLVAVTRDCTSKRMVLVPSIVALMTLPGKLDYCDCTNNLFLSCTSIKPCEVMVKRAISLIEPKRFLKERNMR